MGPKGVSGRPAWLYSWSLIDLSSPPSMRRCARLFGLTWMRGGLGPTGGRVSLWQPGGAPPWPRLSSFVRFPPPVLSMVSSLCSPPLTSQPEAPRNIAGLLDHAGPPTVGKARQVTAPAPPVPGGLRLPLPLSAIGWKMQRMLVLGMQWAQIKGSNGRWSTRRCVTEWFSLDFCCSTQLIHKVAPKQRPAGGLLAVCGQ